MTYTVLQGFKVLWRKIAQRLYHIAGPRSHTTDHKSRIASRISFTAALSGLHGVVNAWQLSLYNQSQRYGCKGLTVSLAGAGSFGPALQMILNSALHGLVKWLLGGPGFGFQSAQLAKLMH